MPTDLHVKCPLFLSELNKTWNFLDIFSKNTQISNVVKIRPVGANFFFHADGQTDMKKVVVDFSNFAKEHKKFHFSHTVNWGSI